MANRNRLFFHTTLLGGGWLEETTCRKFDCYMGGTRNKDAEAWCVAYGLYTSARFDVHRYGGETTSRLLADQFSQRWEYMYNIFRLAYGERIAYTEADLAGFEPTHTVDVLVADLAEPYKTRARVALTRMPR